MITSQHGSKYEAGLEAGAVGVGVLQGLSITGLCVIQLLCWILLRTTRTPDIDAERSQGTLYLPRFTLLLSNLVVTHYASTVLILPIAQLQNINAWRWPLGEPLCEVWQLGAVASRIATAILGTALIAQCSLAILHPARHDKLVQNRRLLFGAVWTLIALLALVGYLAAARGKHLAQHPLVDVDEFQHPRCHMYIDSTAYTLYITGIFFWLPTIAQVVIYIILITKLRKATNDKGDTDSDHRISVTSLEIARLDSCDTNSPSVFDMSPRNRRLSGRFSRLSNDTKITDLEAEGAGEGFEKRENSLDSIIKRSTGRDSQNSRLGRSVTKVTWQDSIPNDMVAPSPPPYHTVSSGNSIDSRGSVRAMTPLSALRYEKLLSNLPEATHRRILLPTLSHEGFVRPAFPDPERVFSPHTPVDEFGLPHVDSSQWPQVENDFVPAARRGVAAKEKETKVAIIELKVATRRITEEESGAEEAHPHGNKHKKKNRKGKKKRHVQPLTGDVHETELDSEGPKTTDVSGSPPAGKSILKKNPSFPRVESTTILVGVDKQALETVEPAPSILGPETSEYFYGEMDISLVGSEEQGKEGFRRALYCLAGSLLLTALLSAPFHVLHVLLTVCSTCGDVSHVTVMALEVLAALGGLACPALYILTQRAYNGPLRINRTIKHNDDD